MADDFSERDDAIGDQFRVLDAFRDRFRSVRSYLLLIPDIFDELFVRVDPWLGLRFNSAMNKKIALVLILLSRRCVEQLCADKLLTRRAYSGDRRSRDEIPLDS